MDRVIVTPEEVEPAWLTATLRRAGALEHGSVEAVQREPLEGNWSSNAYLLLRYAVGSRGECPSRLFIKTSHGFSRSEVDYYARDYVGVAGAPLVRCFDAKHDEDERRYHLLLEDVSTTHELVMHRPATTGYANALADGFGVMHARWWGAQRLAEIAQQIPSPDHVMRFVETARPGIRHLRDHYDQEIGSVALDKIERYFEDHPRRLVERLGDPRGFCLIHGDANPTNVFVPKRGAATTIYIIDRQPFESSLTVFLGVYDLVHTIVHRWERPDRRRLEVALLKRYLRQLTLRGVTDYGWPQLLDDYALCAGMGLYDAVERCAEGPDEKMKWLWLPMLQRSLQAIEDVQDAARSFAR